MGVYHLAKISVESQMDQTISGKSVRKLWNTTRGSPIFRFGIERWKFPYHLNLENFKSLNRVNGLGTRIGKWNR